MSNHVWDQMGPVPQDDKRDQSQSHGAGPIGPTNGTAAREQTVDEILDRWRQTNSIGPMGPDGTGVGPGPTPANGTSPSPTRDQSHPGPDGTNPDGTSPTAPEVGPGPTGPTRAWWDLGRTARKWGRDQYRRDRDLRDRDHRDQVWDRDRSHQARVRDQRNQDRVQRRAELRGAAPEALSTFVYLAAVASAVFGQVSVATGRYGWSMFRALLLAGFIELMALAMATTANNLRLRGEQALAPRVLTWAFAGFAAGINVWGHWSDPLMATGLGAASLGGITLWEIRSSARHRETLRSMGMIPNRMTHFGWRAWLHFRGQIWAARRLDILARQTPQAMALLVMAEQQAAAEQANQQAQALASTAQRAVKAAIKGSPGDAGTLEALQTWAEQLSATQVPGPLALMRDQSQSHPGPDGTGTGPMGPAMGPSPVPSVKAGPEMGPAEVGPVPPGLDHGTNGMGPDGTNSGPTWDQSQSHGTSNGTASGTDLTGPGPTAGLMGPDGTSPTRDQMGPDGTSPTRDHGNQKRGTSGPVPMGPGGTLEPGPELCQPREVVPINGKGTATHRRVAIVLDYFTEGFEGGRAIPTFMEIKRALLEAGDPARSSTVQRVLEAFQRQAQDHGGNENVG